MIVQPTDGAIVGCDVVLFIFIVLSLRCVDDQTVFDSNFELRSQQHLCPSGLRGSTQVRMYSYSWVQIPPDASPIILEFSNIVELEITHVF